MEINEGWGLIKENHIIWMCNKSNKCTIDLAKVIKEKVYPNAKIAFITVTSEATYRLMA